MSEANSRCRLIPILAARLFFLSPDENYDPTLTSIIPHILTEAAMDYALVSTSITCLKPFLKPFHTGGVVNRVGGAGSGVYAVSPGQGYTCFLHFRRDSKQRRLPFILVMIVRGSSG
jgi:hypothetical protein